MKPDYLTTEYEAIKAYIGHSVPEINDNQIRMLACYVQNQRADEVERFGDYLVDLDTEAAFEQGWQQYCYSRLRELDGQKD